MNTIDFKVCIDCVTFNHASYITDAFDGFCMQQTKFPFVCTIVDDASTDGEQDIINEYLLSNFDLEASSAVKEETDDCKLIFAQHKKNKNCFFAVNLLKYNHYRAKKTKDPYFKKWEKNKKYIATCEGDDYWINPNKLQLQFDTLEKNEAAGLCYTKSYEQGTGKKGHPTKVLANNRPTDFESLILYEPKITLTAFYRNELKEQFDKEITLEARKLWRMGDTPLILWFSLNSKIIALDEITAVYRVLPESASHSDNIEKLLQFRKSYLDIRLFFLDNYYNDASLKLKVMESYNREVLNLAYNFGKLKLYFSTLKKLNNRVFIDWINGGKLLIKSIISLKNIKTRNNK